MKKTDITILAIVLLLMVSLAFAQQGQKTVVEGDVVAVPAPGGVIVAEEQVAVTVPIKRTQQKPAIYHRAKTTNQTAATRATHVQNMASIKKGEPKLQVTTTETNDYNVEIRNKKGTTNYGVMEQTVTNAQGKKNTDGIVYSTYTPSKMARTNEKKMEISLAGGITTSYNKDTQNNRYGDASLATSLSALYNINDYLALGVDYMMLHQKSKNHEEAGINYHYSRMYAHDISLAGKLTINPWDKFQIYSPMGIGMLNARMKTSIAGANFNENKWGAAFYAGLGMQYNLTDCLFVGAEYRYTYAFISDKDLTPSSKDRDLQFHTALLRMGMRF